MSDETSARLGLPYLVAGQLQKHITLNEALTRLDALVQAAVVSRTTTTQPASAVDGDLYILPAGASGANWDAHNAGTLVRAEFGAWATVAPVEGAVVWIADEDQIVVRRDGGWTPLGGLIRELQAVTRIGINTEADAGNPFAAKLNKALWTALGVGEGGDGDLRMTLNKSGPSDVLSLLFQSGYGGRAELGLIGDDDLTLKVSTDGGTWRQALAVDRASGAVAFPAGCGRAETTVLTASATFNVPAWARRIEALAVGGGGGGGSGAVGAAGTSRFGGGGGGAGGLSLGGWAKADLAASLTVVIGGGGAGGSIGAGAAGANGGASTLTSGGVVILTGHGGGGGAGGNASGGAAGVGGVGAPISNGGGAGSVSTTAGTGVSLARPDGCGGGGAGGGLDASNTVRAGGPGGPGGMATIIAAGGAGGSGAVGGPGGPASAPALSPASGGGGGGGASIGSGYAGGAGAAGGSGGGGGGAGVTASGAGGAGGAGVVRITTIG